MNATTAIVLGAAVVVVGYLVIQANKPPPSPVPQPAPTSGAAGILATLLNSPLGKMGTTRLGEALDGERDWW